MFLPSSDEEGGCEADGRRDVNEVQAKACMKFMRRINEVCYANDVFPEEI